MKFSLGLLLFLSLSASCLADRLPLYTEITLPSGQRANIQDAVTQLLKISINYREKLEAGDDFQANIFFKEYHTAITRSNEDIAAKLPASIYFPLLKQLHAHIVKKATASFLGVFSYLKLQAQLFGSGPIENIDKMEDEVLLNSIGFIAENFDITAYNIDLYSNSLNDPELQFDLILNVLFVYQFQFFYQQKKDPLGSKFSDLLSLLLRENKLDKEREEKLLKLIFSLKDTKLLKWYKNSRVEFNTPLYSGPSVFCYTSLGLIQQHLQNPIYVTEEQIISRLKAFIIFGASLNAYCSDKNLSSTLIDWKKREPKISKLIDRIINLEDNIYPISRRHLLSLH